MPGPPYALPSSNLSFSICSTTLGNTTPGSSSNLLASVLFGDNWTAPNGIIGYGALQNSGADRIANSPTTIDLSGYLGLNTRGDSSTFGGGFGSYWSLWDNSLSGAFGNYTFYSLYFYLYDSTKSYQLTQDSLGNLNQSTNTGYTNIGNGIPLVQYAYWVVSFDTGKMDTSTFTFEILCSIDAGNFNPIFSINQTWTDNTTYTFAWDDPGNSAVETDIPTTSGYAFQMLFYP
jgi:hypothetical protein